MIFKRGLEILLDDSHSKLRTTLCGWKTGKYLLIEEPAGRNVREGVSLVARFSHDGCYYGFNVEALGHLPEAHILVLKYPDDIMQSCVRKNSRLEVALPVNIFRGDKPSDALNDALITDLSAGGLNFSCFMSLNVGETVGVVGALEPEHPEMALSFIVRSVKTVGMKYEYGGEFVFSEGSAENALKTKVDRLDHLAHGMIDEDPPPAPSQLAAPVGTRMQFQIGMTKILSALRGSSRKYLFIDTPVEKGKPVIVARGTPIHVKFAALGMGYAFETEIVKQYTSPAALWALSHPGATRSMTLRRNTRLRTLIPSVIETSVGMRDGAIIDLSEVGALFMADGDNHTSDTQVTLNFVLPTGGPVDNIVCQVRNTRNEDGKTYIGLSFIENNPAAIGLIKSYVESCSKFL
ncbi:MAG: flagellar brake domain-containing protein [Nitrospinae bacterium]|nr:flagellar brake domain-containing protein [Nitrospinota bacterium]